MVKIDEEKEQQLLETYKKLPKSYETIKVLAKENEVSERTIYRILEKNDIVLPSGHKKRLEEEEWKKGAIDISTLTEMESAITIEKKITELLQASETETELSVLKVANWIRYIRARSPKFDWMRLLYTGLADVIRKMESNELFTDIMNIKQGDLPLFTIDGKDSTKKNNLVSMKEASETALKITENKVQKVLLDKLLTLDDDEQDSDDYDADINRLDEIEAEEREIMETFMSTNQQIKQMNSIPMPNNMLSMRNMMVENSKAELMRLWFRGYTLAQEKHKLSEKKENEIEEKNYKLELIQRKIREASEGEIEVEQ